MRKLAPLVLALSLFAVAASSPQTATPPPPNNYVFVEAGQSNMERIEDLLETALKDTYGDETTVIKGAVSGTSINAWQRGKTPYENAKAATLAAIAQGGTVQAILMFHGEADAKSAVTAPQYRELYYDFAHDFRQDIGAATIPIIHAVIGNAMPLATFPYRDTVYQEQIDISINHVNLPHFFTNDMDRPDGVHIADYDQDRLVLRFINHLTPLVIP